MNWIEMADQFEECAMAFADLGMRDRAVKCLKHAIKCRAYSNLNFSDLKIVHAK